MAGTLSQVWIRSYPIPGLDEGGGIPIPGPDRGRVPHPADRGIPHSRSGQGVPHPADGGLPHPRSRQGVPQGTSPSSTVLFKTGWCTPHSGLDWAIPCSGLDGGTPLSRTGWGTPIKRQISIASTCCAAGGMQEDFLVTLKYFNIRYQQNHCGIIFSLPNI